MAEHKEKLRSHTAWNKGLKRKIVNGKQVYYKGENEDECIAS